MALTIKVIKTAGIYSLCELSVRDNHVFQVVGYRLLDGNAGVVENFDTEAQGSAALNSLALPWRGVIPKN